MPTCEHALLFSGDDMLTSDSFFERVDRVLRRSLGVSESARADTTVKPAPPVEYAWLLSLYGSVTNA